MDAREDKEILITRGQSLKLASDLLKKIKDLVPEKSEKGLTRAHYEEAARHLDFINQFYL